MRLPAARGPLSAWLTGVLTGPVRRVTPPPVAPVDDPIGDEDLQLSLAVAYALHTYGIVNVDDDWEWSPALLGFRAALERPFEAALRREAVLDRRPFSPGEVSEWLVALSRRGSDGPSLPRYLAREATGNEFREFVIHRSIYTLHEADPHTFAIPRLRGAPKAALVEIQADEYGNGSLPQMHAALFARTMRCLDLDPETDRYMEVVPATTLATVNLVWMLGLHRRLRGAAAGHLALFELTSPVPNRAYGNGLRRLGFGEEVTDYYDEHVEADSVHEMIAAFDLAGGLAREELLQVPQILFGAAALDVVERRFGRTLLDAWGAGRSSLRGSELSAAAV